ncbi:hypothetical protein Tco_0746799 [Tanacetum coccineum]
MDTHIRTNSSDIFANHQGTKIKKRCWGSESDCGEQEDEKNMQEACLLAKASNSVHYNSSYYSDENSSLDDDELQNEYNKLSLERKARDLSSIREETGQKHNFSSLPLPFRHLHQIWLESEFLDAKYAFSVCGDGITKRS